MDAPSIVRETFPKECVPSTGFGQRSSISQTSFRQCGNVDIVSAELAMCKWHKHGDFESGLSGVRWNYPSGIKRQSPDRDSGAKSPEADDL